MSRKYYMGLILLLATLVFLPDAALAATYYISTADELAALSTNVAFGTDYHGDIVELTDNMTIYGFSWDPIGKYGVNKPFMGTFDGKGYDISFESPIIAESPYFGLFGFIGPYGTVKNLRVCADINAPDTAGGIAAQNYGTVLNCSFSGAVRAGSYGGGLIGSNAGSLYNSYNEGTVNAYRAGGLVGSYMTHSGIKNCYNTGTVIGNTIGGLVGSAVNSTIEHCYWLDSSAPQAIGIDSWNTKVDPFSVSLISRDPLLEALNIDAPNGCDQWVLPADPYSFPVFRTLSINKTSVNLGSAEYGSTAPAADTVTVTNYEHHALALNSLPGSLSFSVTEQTNTVPPEGGYTILTVQPRAGLPVGTYGETISFSTTSATSVSINVSFTVQSLSIAITAGPALISFADAVEGYTLPAAQTVTVTNTGNQPVTLIQPTAADFNFGTLSKLSITPLEEAAFTLQPKFGLKEGCYSEAIVIQGLSGAAASVDVRFTVTAAPSFQISASPSVLDFGSLAEWYIQPAVQIVTITNMGKQSISLYQPTASHYEIGVLSKTALAPLNTASFTITPKAGLTAGVWIEAINILGSQGVSTTADATFTCTTPIDYSILSGNGSTFQQDEPGSGSMTITANGDIHKFTGLMLSGELVDESDYDVSEGSTVVTLHQDFLDTLQPGTYTLRFQYTDGFAEASFTVQDQMPATGDNDSLLLFGSLAALSLAAIILFKRKTARHLA